MALQGLAGGDLTAAIAGGLSPYLAEQVKKQIGEDNVAANAIAHAIVGGVIAELQGRDAGAGAAGAAAGELIAQALYPGVKREDLDETQKQKIVALSTLAAGLAGGLAGDDTAGIIAGAQGGKNASENNHLNLPSGMMDYAGGAFTLAEQMVQEGKSAEEINAVLKDFSQGDLPEGANITKAIVEGYQDGVLIAGGIYLGPVATVGKVIGGGILALSANGGYQYYDLSQAGNENKSWDYKASAASFATGMLAPGREIPANIAIGMGSAWFSDGLDGSSQTGAFLGGLTGGAFGKFAPVITDKVIGKDLPGFIYDFSGGMISEFTNGAIKDASKPASQPEVK